MRKIQMRNNLGIVIRLVLVLSVVAMAFSVNIEARTLDEIGQEIDESEKELSTLQKQLEEKQAQLNTAKNSKNSAQNELSAVKAEIEQMELELELSELELAELEVIYEKHLLQKEEVEKKQDEQLQALYMNSKDSGLTSVFGSTTDPLKINYYLEILAETDQDSLNSSYEMLAGLEEDIGTIEVRMDELEQLAAELDAKKLELERAVASLAKQESSYASGVKQLQPKITATQEELTLLSTEQKTLQDYESRLINQNPNGGSKPLEDGEYYFSGRGRDLYQGHGVGLSQFGAYGAARAGWAASRIIKHYYKGVTIGQGSGTVNIIGGRQNIPLEEYVAGLGEVPNKACGTAAQAAQRPDKYVVDNTSTVWDCWPEETIKAQVIAARTYGLRNKNVYPDARSQVYTGTTLKQWAADETKGQVIYYNGKLISAVYSSDNNNGWGTANNDTVWSNYSGDGTPYPYLRSVYDENIAYHYKWSVWTYRTNSYTVDDLNAMLKYSATSGNIFASARSFMTSVRADIGTLESLEFVRDPSGRVKKVKLNGSRGSRYMAGWLYKTLWNVWVGNVKPSGQADYIYSLTFHFKKA